MEPPVVRVPKTSTVAQAETLISRLEGMPRDADLLLPTEPKTRELGGTAALLQLIITWHRQCPDGAIRCHVNPAHDNAEARLMVERLISRDHGLVGFTLAGRLKDLTAARDLTDLARLAQQARLGAMNQGELSRGTKAFVVAVDQTAWSRPPMIYPRPHTHPDAVGNAADMAATIEWIDHKIRERSWHLFAPAAVPAVGVLLEELIKNTHLWARNDEEEHAYETSVRGLRIEAHERDAEAIARAAGDDERLLGWATSLADRGGRLRLVELTVFDAGPGLPARALSRTQGDEYAALEWCLRLHYSTARGLGRGLGLHQCLATLTELQAFVRVRCLSLERWRDFRADPYRPGADPREPYLKELDRRTAGGASGRAAGTSYTILLPAVPA